MGNKGLKELFICISDLTHYSNASTMFHDSKALYRYCIRIFSI